MAQLPIMQIQTKTSDLFLLASSQRNANLSLSKKKLSISCRNKRLNVHIACTVGKTTATDSITQPRKRIDPAEIDIRKSMFPPGFKFGAASSAYQVEGAWNEGGRGPSIWDTFSHDHPEKTGNGNGDIAADSYHKYKDDVKILKELGVDSYRFSISWSRILPDGTLEGGRNKEGIMYYNNLINELIKNGITPFVTLFHWDVPLALETKYGGFLDKRIVNDFKDYCQICFQEFGDRVKNWITLNEPWTFSSFGYSLGKHAPGRGLHGCFSGSPRIEPYIVGHNLILAHGEAVKLYKNHFQSIQRGEIGITLVSMWYKPYSESIADKAAALRGVEFMLGWYMDPLINGDYPAIMRDLVRERLPKFTEDESKMIKGSYDFVGLNYYTSRYAKEAPNGYISYISITDYKLVESEHRVGVPIGDKHGTWIRVVPDGMKELLNYTKEKYGDPKIYITENGSAQLDEDQSLSKEEAIYDQERVEYMTLHLAELLTAIEEGTKVAGYFAWSLTDNFEWHNGYNERFGLYYIDFKNKHEDTDHENKLERFPKKSADWYTKFLSS